MNEAGLQKILADSLCLFLLLFSYVNVVRNKRFHFPWAEGFILMNVFALIFEIVAVILEKTGTPKIRWMLYIPENGYNISALAATGCWFINSLHITGNRLYRKKYLIPLMIPLAAAALLTLTTGIHHKVFYFTESCQYVRGAWFVSFFAVAAFYLAAAFMFYVSAERNKEIYVFRNLNLLASLYTLFMIVCMAIQVVTKNAMSVINAACAVVALMIHEDFQKKDVTLDALTGLNNRNAINDRLTRILRSGKFTGYVILLDVDSFKQINDRYGHLEGDRALVSAAEAMIAELADRTFFGRLGGDEFLIIAEGISEEQAAAAETGINRKLEEILKGKNSEYCVTVSAGYVAVNGGMKTIPDILKAADVRLYARKQEKKN